MSCQTPRVHMFFLFLLLSPRVAIGCWLSDGSQRTARTHHAAAMHPLAFSIYHRAHRAGRAKIILFFCAVSLQHPSVGSRTFFWGRVVSSQSFFAIVVRRRGVVAVVRWWWVETLETTKTKTHHVFCPRLFFEDEARPSSLIFRKDTSAYTNGELVE